MYGLRVITYSEPFSVSDLMAVADTVGVPGPGKEAHRALLIDLRRVELAGISAEDSRKFIAARKMRMTGTSAEPAAFVIRSAQNFGNIRMHNLWSEALGLRKEEDTLITLVPEEALLWIADRTEQPSLVEGLLPLLFPEA